MSTVARTLKSTDGNDIYADATGDPQNPSIVFVHGMTFSGAVFDCLFANKRLLEKFYLVCIISHYSEQGVPYFFQGTV
jgi:pimeloyl-ACP methyl ester carboxylesterase